MRALIIWAILLLSGFHSNATNRTWNGSNSTFSLAQNWDPSGVPTATDNLIFQGGFYSTFSCNINNTSIGNLIIEPGYTGQINVTGTFTVNGSYTQKGGVVSVQNASVQMNGVFQLEGGTFNSGNCFLQMNNSFIQKGGVLNAVSASIIFNGLCSLEGGTFNGGNGINLNQNTSLSLKGGTFNALGSTLVLDGALSLESGTFNGGNANITFKNTFQLSGGTFNSTTNTLVLTSNITSTAGVFNHNSGVVQFDLSINNTLLLNCSNPFSFYVLQTLSNDISSDMILNFGTTACNAQTLTLGMGISSILWTYRGNIEVKAELNILGSNTNNPFVNSPCSFEFNGNNITINGTPLAGQNKLRDFKFNTPGNINLFGHISLRGNWTNVSGNLVHGHNSTVHFYPMPTFSISSGSSFENLNIESGATPSIAPNSIISVASDFSVSGSVNTLSNSVLALNGGTVNQFVSCNSCSVAGLWALSGLRNISFASAFTVMDSVKLESNVTLQSNGTLILNSNANKKARLARAASGATVTGNVIVKTFIPGPNTGWAQWGSNGLLNQTVSNWDGQIPMTCNSCILGTTAVAGGFCSVQHYLESSNSYSPATSTDPLPPGKGIWVYVGSDYYTTTDFVLSNTGPLAIGPISLPVTNGSGNGLNLISNPYPCPILWSELFDLNESGGELSSAYYVYSADRSGDGYASYSAGVSIPAGALSNTIAAGQGFFIDNNSLSTLNFTENVKIFGSGGNIASVQKIASSEGDVIRLKFKGPNDYHSDETVIRLHPQASNSFDNAWDAKKLFSTPGYAGYPGPYSYYTTLSSQWNGLDYSINSLPPITGSLSIPILARVASSGNYSFTFTKDAAYEGCALLYDKVTNTLHDLKKEPCSVYISDTTSRARFELILCESGNTLANYLPERRDSGQIQVYSNGHEIIVNTPFNYDTETLINVYDLLGQKIMNEVRVFGSERSTKLFLETDSRMILVSVRGKEGIYTKRIVLQP